MFRKIGILLATCSSMVWVGGCATKAAIHAPRTAEIAETTPTPVRVAAPLTPLNRLSLEEKRQGYFVNNAAFTDAAGEVVEMCRFSDTGFVTYALGDSDVLMRKNTYAVKARDMGHPNTPAIKLGALVRERGTQWIFKTNDGKQIEADWYRLQSQGILLVRNRNQVTFVGIDGMARPYTLPPGFVVSSYQEWDIAATRLLLTLHPSEQAAKGNGELEIGLLDIDTGKLGTLLGFSVRNKSESDQLQYVRSVFSMVNSPSGPIVIAVENGERRVVVRGLRNGMQATAFDQSGEPWRIQAGADRGKVWLNAQQGQSQKRIADVEAFLANQLPAQAAN